MRNLSGAGTGTGREQPRISLPTRWLRRRGARRVGGSTRVPRDAHPNKSLAVPLICGKNAFLINLIRKNLPPSNNYNLPFDLKPTPGISNAVVAAFKSNATWPVIDFRI